MGVPLGRLFGTDIRATVGFFLLLAYCFYIYRDEGVASAGIVCLAIVVSLLVHEFGHVFAVRRQLHAESVVILWGLGGLCVHEPARTPRQKVIISLTGPAFTALLAAASFAILLLARPSHPALLALVRTAAFINTIWLVFNLLPIRPLDGGQALEAYLAGRIGEGRARGAIRRTSIVVAGATAVGAYLLGSPMATVLAILLLMQNLMAPA